MNVLGGIYVAIIPRRLGFNYIPSDWSAVVMVRRMLPSTIATTLLTSKQTESNESTMACSSSPLCLGMCEWTDCPGASGNGECSSHTEISTYSVNETLSIMHCLNFIDKKDIDAHFRQLHHSLDVHFNKLHSNGFGR